MASPARRDSVKGFTLIELMLSLTILGILLAVAVPSFREYQANQAVRSAASQLVSAMNFARSEAVKRNVATGVTVSAKGDWNTGWQVTSADVTLMDFVGPAGVRIDTTVSSLTYQGTGRPEGAVSFTVAPVDAEVLSQCVRVSGSGKPSNRKADPDGVCP